MTTGEADTVTAVGNAETYNTITPGDTSSAAPGGPTQVLASGTIPTLAERMEDVLSLMGINASTNPNALDNLIAQSNYEYPSGPVGNNLLGTSIVLNGSTSTNSSGVQSYSTWQDGVYAAALMLSQSNNTAAATALGTNASAPDYATALGNSDWEGGGAGSSGNVSYGQSFLARYNSLVSAGALAKEGSAAVAATGAAFSGGATPESDGLPTLSTLSSIFGLNFNWSEIGTIALGIVLIIVGLVFWFHKDAGKMLNIAALA